MADTFKFNTKNIHEYSYKAYLKKNHKGRKKGKRINEVIDLPDGTQKKIKIRLNKSLPFGCKTAKRICIKCLTKVIHKNDKNYDSKICKDCTTSEFNIKDL